MCKENSFDTENDYFYRKFTNHKKMNLTFDISRTSRRMIAPFLENYTLEQLNTIPEGFNNNLIWNIAHIVVTQQLLVYKLAGLPMMVSDELVERYKKGTKTEHQATQEEVDEIFTLLHSTIEQTEKDIEKNLFQNYNEYQLLNLRKA